VARGFSCKQFFRSLHSPYIRVTAIAIYSRAVIKEETREEMSRSKVKSTPYTLMPALSNEVQSAASTGTMHSARRLQTDVNADEDTASSLDQSVLLIPTLHNNPQVPGCYPGFAFCRFTPGIIETIIRVSIVVCRV